MISYGRVGTSTFILLMLIGAFLVPSIANAQTTSHYGAKAGSSGANPVGFDLTIYSPNNQTVYADTLTIDFNISWNYGLMLNSNSILFGQYAYTIDNNPAVSISSSQKSTSASNFNANQSFSVNIDISNLTNGKHQLVIIAAMEYNPFGGGASSIFNASSTPVQFLVQNPPPTPKAGVFVPLAKASIVAVVVILLVVVVLLLLFRRNRKSLKVNKPPDTNHENGRLL